MAIRTCPHCGTTTFTENRSVLPNECTECGLDLGMWYSMAMHNAKVTGKCLSIDEIERDVFDMWHRNDRTIVSKRTNFDSITKSPEKLANWLSGYTDCGICPAENYCFPQKDQCEKAWLEWLQEKASD